MILHGLFSLVLALNGLARAATADEWRSRSIYQVFTDRFSHEDGSTTTPCDTVVGKYCGGSWQGVIKNLDYIQNMGFSAVSILRGLCVLFADEETDLDISRDSKFTAVHRRSWFLSWVLATELISAQ